MPWENQYSTQQNGNSLSTDKTGTPHFIDKTADQSDQSNQIFQPAYVPSFGKITPREPHLLQETNQISNYNKNINNPDRPTPQTFMKFQINFKDTTNDKIKNKQLLLYLFCNIPTFPVNFVDTTKYEIIYTPNERINNNNYKFNVPITLEYLNYDTLDIDYAKDITTESFDISNNFIFIDITNLNSILAFKFNETTNNDYTFNLLSIKNINNTTTTTKTTQRSDYLNNLQDPTDENTWCDISGDATLILQSKDSTNCNIYFTFFQFFTPDETNFELKDTSIFITNDMSILYPLYHSYDTSIYLDQTGNPPVDASNRFQTIRYNQDFIDITNYDITIIKNLDRPIYTIVKNTDNTILTDFTITDTTTELILNTSNLIIDNILLDTTSYNDLDLEYIFEHFVDNISTITETFY